MGVSNFLSIISNVYCVLEYIYKTKGSSLVSYSINIINETKIIAKMNFVTELEEFHRFYDDWIH